MKQFVENIQEFKRVSKPWARVYSTNQEKQLNEVEISLKEIYEWNSTGVLPDIKLKEVKEKELKREELLARKEVLQTLKSRAIWIKEGDNNTESSIVSPTKEGMGRQSHQ